METEIIGLLRDFEEGYRRRDTAFAAEFVGRLFLDNAVVLGTSNEELCKGHDEILKLVTADWRFWGAVEIDYQNVHISVFGNTAGVIATGILNWQIPNELFLKKTLADIGGLLERKENPGLTLMRINELSGRMILESGRGETHLLPLRISAALRRENGSWKFAQLVFSYSTERYPDCRMG